MRVVVIGAGVGGLALAAGLVERGIGVEVHEKDERLHAGGAGVGLYPNGVAALNELGVAVDDLGRPIDVMETRDPEGRPALNIDVARISEHFGFVARTVPRRALLDRLHHRLPEGALHLGRECVGVRLHADGTASAVFSDGTRSTGDVVVGADGAGSVVRAQLLGEDPPAMGRWASWQGLSTLDSPRAGGRVASLTQGRQGICGIMPAGNGLVHWWFDVRWRRGLPVTDDPVPVLRELFSSWNDPDVRAVLEQIESSQTRFFPHLNTRVRGRWGQDNTTLLGDAAHIFPPATAQGANQALEDAWALVTALGDSGARADPAWALRRYEEVRHRPAAVASFASSLNGVQRIRLPRLPVRGLRDLPGNTATRWFGGYLSAVSNVLTGQRP
ncbi:FAD-dependent monooxygenase [Nocardiopsis kunsanensis]|uniref:FAD-dependent monooxygenase n=1 Tax=Nocardiopsis kunsanensis TaxID=141693 RepID=A0A919CIX3_9ACTN|nr:FAD-dependent monooxygenase [Nocardiopsis kunsanensis]GHD28469.1 FAD-dependent monooxygenase [Nocardiopsis kunsanensis]